MCLLCFEIAKKNMTINEVARAYSELPNNGHTDELLRTIKDSYSNEEFIDAILDLQAEFNDKDKS